jgi:hypothetical protein
MRIVVNHLTRMHGGHICVAGVDLQTDRHVRPVLEQQPLNFDLLARYGGPFDMACVVDLGCPRPMPNPPHVEDCVLIPARARLHRRASAEELWALLERHGRRRLSDIFGPELRPVGSSGYGTSLGCGRASLGCLRPERRPEIYLTTAIDGKRRIRMKIADGEIEAVAAVTDLRLYRDDHATPDEQRVRAVAHRIRESEGVVLGVGLTRGFRATAESPEVHWLQVNNIHLKEEPDWPLG